MPMPCGDVVARGGVEPPTFRFSGRRESFLIVVIDGVCAGQAHNRTLAMLLRTGLSWPDCERPVRDQLQRNGRKGILFDV